MLYVQIEEILALKIRVQKLELELNQVRIGGVGTGVGLLGARSGKKDSDTSSYPLLT